MASPREIAQDLAYIRTNISNVYFAGTADRWVLIDAGVVGYTAEIASAAERRFGTGARPEAILLTHGHYDHVGCARELATRWGVRVYAHPLEFPYLTGKSAYPRKDPTVGGAMAFLVRFFPSRTANLSDLLEPLPADGSVPALDGWRAVFTPGHAPGHVCFWRESGRALVAGDAAATVDLDSWSGMMMQRRQVSRPPSPITYDWEQARASVELIAELRPKVLACGHGEPISGDSTADELEKFAAEFSAPKQGRYVREPARVDDTGVTYEPPRPADHTPKIAAGAAAGVFLLAGLVYRKRTRRTEL